MGQEPIKLGSVTGVWSYLLTIDWEEPWLWCLTGFHIWCVVLTFLVLTFRAYKCQVTAFVVYLLFVSGAPYINEWAATNYKLFSEQQYFDSMGMFISIVFSLPLLCNTFVIVMYWMWDVTKVMIKVKRGKLIEQMKEKQNSEPSSEQTPPSKNPVEKKTD